MSNRGVSKGQQVVRVKTVDASGNWYTVSKHFNWDAAVESYNATATPKMIVTRTKVAHKQFTNNGFVYNGTDPRTF
jgi:hypothetical protein